MADNIIWRIFDWNPVTIKRWRRFRQLHRAWWSLWILLALYAISLVAEMICNNTPLLVRFNGHNYVPIVRFHPEDVFLKNGRQTRPDYKQISLNPAFTNNPRNFMIFPPVPYGPFENIDPASLTLSAAVTLKFQPEPRVASVTMSPHLVISQSAGTGFFFDAPPELLLGQSFTNYWPIPAVIGTAILARFRNEASPALLTTVSSCRHPRHEAELSLPEFMPRATAPTTVRVTLREKVDHSTLTRGDVKLDNRLNVVSSTFAPWFTLSPEARSNLTTFAAQSLISMGEDRIIELGGNPYIVSASKTEVRWPYPPVRGHWLGIDSSGRDVLARILYGLRTSLTFGFLLVILAMVLGATLGAIQGYFGGKADIIGQRFTEMWSALPFLYVMILLGAVYGRGFILLLVCYAIFNWIGISYYIRAEFLRLRHLPFVEAARSLGLPHHTIIFRHILPNAMVPLITFFPFNLVGAIGALAALDYLGFGLPPPTPSWGELLQQAQQFRWAWWLILYPALSLFIVMLLGVFIGEGIRNAYDPRPKTRFE
ncbi:MAG: ABC transporter permease subunit [bacterium]